MWVTDYLEASAPTDPKMTLSTTRSKVHKIKYVLIIALRSLRFLVQPAVLRVAGQFEACDRNDPKVTEHYDTDDTRVSDRRQAIMDFMSSVDTIKQS